MPIYEYRCTKCGHRFERIQHFNAEPERECPRCLGTLERPLTAPALQFKGSGWYVNDYASKSSARSSEGSSDSSAAPAETKAPSTASDSAASAPAAAPTSTPPATSGSTP